MTFLLLFVLRQKEQHYYTITPTARLHSYGVTIAIIEDFVAVGYRVAFQSEEIRAALLFLQFKYQPLSLCKSLNVEKAATDYDTVAAFASVRLLRSDKRYVEDAVAASRLVLVENT
ncbi:MAG: hypothetical protein I8H68_08340 [Flavobacteriia bacterium]|nr:hypothetical protein [Flavobacteriia bacterium]